MKQAIGFGLTVLLCQRLAVFSRLRHHCVKIACNSPTQGDRHRSRHPSRPELRHFPTLPISSSPLYCYVSRQFQFRCSQIFPESLRSVSSLGEKPRALPVLGERRPG
ncbi:hypothetical protein CKA32_001235 [Geitlerinema sp. FC II]|nr:hypothetical protein CKA32_001235 [Geitlerinema sp. FC II]